MKIAIIDDAEKFINTATQLLQQYNNCSPLFTSTSGFDCLKQLAKRKVLPDLILMDLNMKDMDGCSATFYIKTHYPEIKVFVISNYHDIYIVEQAIMAGADGYIFKGECCAIFANALQAATNNVPYIDERIVASNTPSAIENCWKKKSIFWRKYQIVGNSILTENEKKYVQLVPTPLSNQQIADLLCVEVKTVAISLGRIYKKLDFHTNKDLAVYAINNGLGICLDFRLANS